MMLSTIYFKIDSSVISILQESMKNYILVMLSAVFLVGCNQGGGSSDSKAQTVPVYDDSVELKSVYPISSNAWAQTQGDVGRLVIQFGASRAKFTSFCADGQAVSVTVAAKLDANFLQILESKNNRVENKDRYCEVWANATSKVAYKIQANGTELYIEGTTLTRVLN